METETKVWQVFHRKEIETIIQGNIRMVEEKMGQMLELFLTSGYYLRRQHREGMYKEAGFERFEDYVRKVYGKSKSWASRMMKINEQYSLGGDSPLIDPKYKRYGVSQLQEMLYLSEEQKEQVTPEMTVQEIRAVRREEPEEEPEKEPEEPLSFYGLPKTVRPEGSLINTPGCGDGKHACFHCSRDCGIRQKERQCRTASCGNPFPCTMMRKKQEIETGLYRDACQHLHPELAPVCEGSKEPDPCCLTCEHKACSSRCDIARKQDEEEQARSGNCEATGEEPEVGWREPKRELPEPEEARPAVATSQPEEEAVAEEDNKESQEEMEPSVPITPQDVLEEEKKKLSEYLEAFKGEKDLPAFIEKQKIRVGALAAFVSDLEAEEAMRGVESEESPLPDFRNNDQRKAWLKDYKAWGLWYEDKHIGAKYYRYRFENGAELIAEVYQEEATQYCGAYESSFLHLVGGPEPQKGQNGIGKWQRHGKYTKHPDSETELVEFLKAVQKEKGEKSE